MIAAATSGSSPGFQPCGHVCTQREESRRVLNTLSMRTESAYKVMMVTVEIAIFRISSLIFKCFQVSDNTLYDRIPKKKKLNRAMYGAINPTINITDNQLIM